MPLGIAIATLSAAALGYEILLMRLFSIAQWHHFASMIISLALLGIGASGAALTLGRAWIEARLDAVLPAAAALFGLTSVAAFTLAQAIPFNPLELAWDARQPAYLMAMYLVLAVPFFFSGGFIGIALTRFRAEAGRIYRFDLVGAGIGALGIVIVLFALPPSQCLRLIAALGFAAAVAASLDARVGASRARAVMLAVCGVALAAAMPGDWLTPRMSPYKGLSQALRVPGTEVAAERSSPLGLLTAVRSRGVPLRHAPGLSLNYTAEPPEQIGVFTDGDALAAITRFDGGLEPLAYLDFQAQALPYHLLERPAVLLLGAGGGEGVLRALYHRARRIDVVELNAQKIGLVERDFADFAGGIYGREEVRVHIADGRAFAGATDERYDLIALSLPGSPAGIRALRASTLFTVEAFADYLRRLAPGGLLAVTGPLALPPRATLKLVATAAAALERLGIGRPGDRLALIRGWDTATLLVRNGALAPADAAAVRAFSRARSFDVAWLPGLRADETNRYNVLAEAYLSDGAAALLGGGREAFLRDYKFHVAPATDDRPYFFRFFRWSALPELADLRGRGGNALIEWGYLVLVGTLAQAVIASVLLIVVPVLALKRESVGAAEGARVVVYFVALGLAFLFVEIAFIQRFTLFLGHPLYAAALVLSAFLGFAGLGSGWSSRLAGRTSTSSAIALAAAGITVVGLAYLAVLPAAFDAVKPLPTWAKFALAGGLVAPLAFCMGMLFPLGLKRLADHAPGWIPWAWAINGCASVIGAVLATALAIHFGFTAVIALAVALYLVAAIAFARAPVTR